MAVTAAWYGLGLEKVAEGSIAFLTDTIKVAMTTVAYTPNQDTDEFWSTPQASEVTGTAYTAGGDALASKTVTYDAGTNEVRLDAADQVWETSTISGARRAVIYKDTGSAATSPLLGHVNFGQDEASSAADFTITWSANGVLRITASVEA
jgi:hypothetical protein